MQNLVILLEPSRLASESHLNAANMILNRFCIDEDAAFELSGVSYLKKTPADMDFPPLYADCEAGIIEKIWGHWNNPKDGDSLEFERKEKGKEYSRLVRISVDITSF